MAGSPSSPPPAAQEPARERSQSPDDDRDSAVGDDDHGSSTASLTSSILHYRTINGRTYHSERGNAQYWAANDDRQNESMDVNHHLLTLVLNGKLNLAPLKPESLKKVLDIGTGTGIWAIDFADQHPEVSVIGTDISPIQPGWVPPNLQFEIEDCTDPWTFEENSFDYVHLRYLFGSIVNWPALYKEAFRVCAPGGWVESHEGNTEIKSHDNTMPKDSAVLAWSNMFFEAQKKMGRSFRVVSEDLQRKGMEEAGFVDLEIHDYDVPMCGWPKDKRLKEMGLYYQLAVEKDLEGYVTFMAKELYGWSYNEVVAFCAKVKHELRSKKGQPSYKQRVVVGRKPK